MRRLLALLLPLCLLLGGCSSMLLEEELLVIVLTVDRSPEGEVTVSIKVPSNSAASIQEDGYSLIEASGHTFSDAVTMLIASTPRPVNFSQVREIIIGEAAARHPDFAHLLRQIDALPRFRCSASVIVCRGEGKAFSQAQKPFIGTRLSRYAENTLSHYAGKGFTPETTLCDGVRDLGFSFQDPLFILGAVNDFSGPSAAGHTNALDAQAGSLPRKSAEPVEVFGAAATDGSRVSGFLSGYEMALIHLIQGHVEALMIRDAQDIAVHVLAKRPAALAVRLEERPARLLVRVDCEALHPPGRPIDKEELARRLEQDISGMIAHLQALRCDGLGFGSIAVRQFLTVQAWDRLSWREVYCQAQAEVRVSVQMKEN